MRKIGYESWSVGDPAKLLEEIKGMSVETFDMWDSNTVNLMARTSYDEGKRDGAIITVAIAGASAGLFLLGKFIVKKIKNKKAKKDNVENISK